MLQLNQKYRLNVETPRFTNWSKQIIKYIDKITLDSKTNDGVDDNALDWTHYDRVKQGHNEESFFSLED